MTPFNPCPTAFNAVPQSLDGGLSKLSMVDNAAAAGGSAQPPLCPLPSYMYPVPMTHQQFAKTPYGSTPNGSSPLFFAGDFSSNFFTKIFLKILCVKDTLRRFTTPKQDLHFTHQHLKFQMIIKRCWTNQNWPFHRKRHCPQIKCRILAILAQAIINM